MFINKSLIIIERRRRKTNKISLDNFATLLLFYMCFTTSYWLMYNWCFTLLIHVILKHNIHNHKIKLDNNLICILMCEIYTNIHKTNQYSVENKTRKLTVIYDMMIYSKSLHPFGSTFYSPLLVWFQCFVTFSTRQLPHIFGSWISVCKYVSRKLEDIWRKYSFQLVIMLLHVP